MIGSQPYSFIFSIVPHHMFSPHSKPPTQNAITHLSDHPLQVPRTYSNLLRLTHARTHARSRPRLHTCGIARAGRIQHSVKNPAHEARTLCADW